MARFRDATGRAGPATWELGSYPEGQADYPVGGISWFEAAAYAEFAGKSLPTLYHWYRASGTDEIYSDDPAVEQLRRQGPGQGRRARGPRAVGHARHGGQRQGVVRERGRADRSLRYILGGGWNEPSYRFAESDAQSPWARRDTFGVRLVKNLGPAESRRAPRSAASTPIPAPSSRCPTSCSRSIAASTITIGRPR